MLGLDVAGPIVLLLFLMTVGVPIGVSLMIAGFVGMWALTGTLEGTLTVLSGSALNVSTTYSFVVVPLFVLLGELAAAIGISSDLFTAFNRFFGRYRGGMAISANLACAGFGAITGSSTSSTAAMTRVTLPEMRKYGYHDQISTGIVASAGTLALLIPPSVALVVFGIMAQESIGQLLMAGVIPGIITAAAYTVVIIILSRLNPQMAPRGQAFSLKEQLNGLVSVVPFGFVAATIVAGIVFGFWTPTEGGAVGVALVLLLGLLKRRVTGAMLLRISRDTLITTASIFTIVIGGLLFSRFLAVSGVAADFIDFVVSLNLNPFVLFLALVAIYIVLGMFMDGFGILALTLPVVLPIVASMGWSKVWFGIVITILIEIALVTPPVGLNLYTIKAVAPDVRLDNIIRGIWPYVAVNILLLMLFYFFPQLVTWLPTEMMKR